MTPTEPIPQKFQPDPMTQKFRESQAQQRRAIAEFRAAAVVLAKHGRQYPGHRDAYQLSHWSHCNRMLSDRVLELEKKL